MNEKQELKWIGYIIDYITEHDDCDMLDDYDIEYNDNFMLDIILDDMYCMEEQMVCEHMFKDSYTFQYFDSEKDNMKGVILADNTMIVESVTGISVMLPKKKFNSILLKQIRNKECGYVGVEFSFEEIDAIVEGFRKINIEKDHPIINMALGLMK